ncbi:MAG: SDR family oxidoreductase [Burkholderiaceae bacterium]|nr:SDR family oxidoreductase [Burkholderiaceae bacterium]
MQQPSAGSEAPHPQAPRERDRTAQPVESVSQRVVVVTGGASGLGAATCAELGAAGARIVVADLAVERAQRCAAQLVESGVDAVAVGVDVADEAQVRRLFDAALGRFGAVDAVVNSAAIDVTAPISELSADDWNRIVRTNLGGVFLVARQACAVMRERGGAIVNVASTASKRAWPNASAYHATKWGVLGLSHALHAELRPQGIKVCAIVAGGMRTPFLLDRFPDIDPTLLQDPRNVARAIRFVLEQPAETVVPEMMVLPMRETSWP